MFVESIGFNIIYLLIIIFLCAKPFIIIYMYINNQKQPKYKIHYFSLNTKTYLLQYYSINIGE